MRRAAPEPNKRALYVGGLDPRVTEDILRQIFETTGHVQNVKIIPDKNMGAVSGDTTLHAVSLRIPRLVMLKSFKPHQLKNRATNLSSPTLTSRSCHYTVTSIFSALIADHLLEQGFQLRFY